MVETSTEELKDQARLALAQGRSEKDGIFSRANRRVKRAWTEARSQVRDPDVEVLAGVVIGSSWGRVIGYTYLGAISLWAGFIPAAIILAGGVLFELWQAVHLGRFFNNYLLAEFEILNGRSSFRPSSAASQVTPAV